MWGLSPLLSNRPHPARHTRTLACVVQVMQELSYEQFEQWDEEEGSCMANRGIAQRHLEDAFSLPFPGVCGFRSGVRIIWINVAVVPELPNPTS